MRTCKRQATNGKWLAGINGAKNQGNNLYSDILVFDKVLSDAELLSAYNNFDDFYIPDSVLISVTGATANYNYSGIDGTIELGAEIIVVGQTANYNYAGINGLIDITALITVTGQTANYDYGGISAEVIIQGAIVVVGSTANYDYAGVNATISLQGPIVVNPINITQAKRNSTKIIVKRNSNTKQVR